MTGSLFGFVGVTSRPWPSPMKPRSAVGRGHETFGRSDRFPIAHNSDIIPASPAHQGMLVVDFVMSQSERVPDCLFCGVVSLPADDLPWHDRPIARVPGVGAVIAGLGAFVPGYVLVFPDPHTESTLRMPTDIHRKFNTLLERAVAAVDAAFGPPTVFEHGACQRTDIRRSACLEHAHVHVMPGAYDLTPSVRPADADEPASTVATADLAHSGYLFLREPRGTPIYAADPGLSQFFRRRIAEKMGIADEWDYLMFPRLDNVHITIKRLLKYLT